MEEESVLRPGYWLDRYELLCPIASGGMAAVWLARMRAKRGFEKLFAIKTIKTELIDDVRFQEMFLDEARIASGIEHPNVAHIIDLGEKDNLLYIVMEWVDGESLSKVMRLTSKAGKPIPLGISLRIMADACAGLHAAHELKDNQGHSLGVVHRDISPHNILVTIAGTTKVIDFGVAKAKNRRAGETGTGIVKGKIRFMAPEQVKDGKSIDRRADLWAIGVCLHELITGVLPFDSDSDVDVVRRLISEDAPPPVDAKVPEPIRVILEHSLVRDVNKRFDTAAAMRRAIENAARELGVSSTTDDVADFLKEMIGDLAAKRRQIVTKAVEAADARATESGNMPAVSAVSADEVAFAPTVMSKRGELTKSETVASTPKKKKKKKKKTEDGEESKMTLAGAELTEEELRVLPNNRKIYALLTFLVLCLGAWFVWPGGARIRGYVFPVSAGPAITPVPTESVSVQPVQSVSAAPSASAVGDAALDAPHDAPTGVRPHTPTPGTTTDPTTTPTPTVTTAPTPAPTPTDPDNPYL